MGRWERRVMWGTVLGVVIYAGLGLWGDVGALMAQARVFPWVVGVGALGLTVVNYAVRFLKWHMCLRAVGVDEVGWGESLNVFLAGFVMSVTPGKVGEVLKSFLLRESHGVEAARTAPIVVAERLTDLLALLVLASFGLAAFDFGRVAFVVVLVAVVGAVVVLGRERWVGWALEKMRGWRFVGGVVPKLEEAYGSMRVLVGPKVLVTTTVMSVVSWSMEGVAFWWILRALGGVDATLFKAMFLFSTGTILGAVSFLPGGLGVTEGTMIGGLLVLGVFGSKAAATFATYAIRLATLWFGVGVGVVALGVWRWRRR